MFRCAPRATLTRPPGLRQGRWRDEDVPPAAHAVLINAINVHLWLLNFSFERGRLRQRDTSGGVNQEVVAGLAFLD